MNKYNVTVINTYETEIVTVHFIFEGLDLSVTKEELAELFSQFGKLSDVRLVTYRNGHSKVSQILCLLFKRLFVLFSVVIAFRALHLSTLRMRWPQLPRFSKQTE